MYDAPLHARPTHMAEFAGEPKRLFIDSDVRVFEGEEATRRLAQRNAAAGYEPGRGITRVDRLRWEEAQRYERRTWMELYRYAADDRNRDHMRRFFGYHLLSGRRFERVIELGCGPFTNLRLILQVARAREVHLLDPLLEAYLAHPHCLYRGARLGGVLRLPRPESVLRLRSPRLALLELVTALRAGGLRGLPVHLETCPIEEFQPRHRFDLVVLVNVLEHCRDAGQVFHKVDEMLLPGGLLVFHEKLLTEASLRAVVENVFDAGHPIRLDRRMVEGFLRPFEVEFRSEFRDREEFAGFEMEATSIYFIGRKRGPHQIG